MKNFEMLYDRLAAIYTVIGIGILLCVVLKIFDGTVDSYNYWRIQAEIIGNGGFGLLLTTVGALLQLDCFKKELLDYQDEN